MLSGQREHRGEPSERPSVFTIFGVFFAVLATVIFVAGLLIHLSGNEVAILLLIVAFGLITFATGLLAVPR